MTADENASPETTDDDVEVEDLEASDVDAEDARGGYTITKLPGRPKPGEITLNP